MRRVLATVAAGVVSLAVLVAVRSAGSPPLYDGVCTPPQYKHLGGNPAPPSASQTLDAAGLGQTQSLADDQNAPQAQIIFAGNTFAAAPGATTVTLTITAVPAPSKRPDGTIDGNVYRFAATSAGQAVAVASTHPVTIALGSTSTGGPNLTLERFDGTTWSALKTFQSGCGTTYDAASATLGLFALVAQGTGSGGSGSSTGSAPILLIVVGVVVVLLAGAILLARRGRGRGRRRTRR